MFGKGKKLSPDEALVRDELVAWRQEVYANESLVELSSRLTPGAEILLTFDGGMLFARHFDQSKFRIAVEHLIAIPPSPQRDAKQD